MTVGVLLLISLLGMGLRLYQLDTDSLWLDEVRTANASRLDFVPMLNFQAEESTHPPLLYVLNRFFLAFLGDSDFVFRLQAALFGSLSLLLTYKLGGMLWTRKEGLIGAFLLAINAYHIRYSQEARHYALLVFLGLLSLIFLLKALQSGKKRMWILFGLCAGLNLYTHYFAFLILASETLFAACVLLGGWLSSRRERQQTSLRDTTTAGPRQHSGVSADRSPPAHSTSPASSEPPNPGRQALSLAAVLAILGMFYLPWLPFMYRQLIGRTVEFQGLGGGGVPGAELSVAFFRDLLIDYTGWDGVPLLLLLALFLIGLSRCRREHLLLFGLWVVIPFLFVAVVRTMHFFSAKYTIFILPPCLLLVGRGTSALANWLGRPLGHRTGQRQTSAVLLSSLTIILGLLNVAPVRDYYMDQKEDWRGTARYLAANLAPGDGIMADSTLYRTGRDADRVTECLTYYLDTYGVTGNSLFRVDQMLWQRLTEWDHWNGRLWAVLWHPQERAVVSADQAVELPNMSIVRLQEPSGDALLDTEHLLRLLLGLIPEGDAQFEVHLALANMYIRTGRLVDAESELGLARELVPDNPTASASLERALARFGRLSQTLSGMRHPLWRNFGNELALLGYTLEPDKAQPGDTLELTAWWYPMQEMDRDYTAFVHILDPNGSVRAQQDKLLQRRQSATSQWKPGAVAMEKYEMVLPADASSGLYTINLGVYYWETAERLSARDESGERQSNDMVQVQQIVVEH